MEKEVLDKIRKDIREAEKRLKVMKEDLSKADKAGIDVAEMKRTYATVSGRIDRLRIVYGG